MSSVLKEKAVKGVAWNLGERFGVQMMNLVLGIVLARLLTPEDYGLIGMILVFFFVADAFIQGGLGEAYVQKKSVSDTDANTVFYANLGISLLLYILLWFAAPFISRFYGYPILVDLTRVMGAILIINAFNIIQEAQIKRSLNFKRKTRISIVSTLISGGLAIYMAYKGFGVWSLLVQRLANRLFLSIGLWISSSWKPTLSFSRESFRTMFSFGSWILAASVIRTIFENIYKLVIGKLFPATELGFYTKSKTFQQLGSQQLSQAVSTVSLPVFSKMQDDKPRMRNAMRTFSRHTTLFIMPLMIGLMVMAEPFVHILLTDKWAPMVPYLQLMCIVGFFYPLHAINIQVLLAQGKSNLNFHLGMVKNVLRVVNIVVSYRWGVFYIIVGEAILSILSLILNTYFTQKFIRYGLLQQLKDIKYIIIGTLGAGIITYLLFHRMDNLWVFLIGGSGVYIAINIILQYLLNRDFFKEVLELRNFLLK